MIPHMIGFVNRLLRYKTMLRTFQMPLVYMVSHFFLFVSLSSSVFVCVRACACVRACVFNVIDVVHVYRRWGVLLKYQNMPWK